MSFKITKINEKNVDDLRIMLAKIVDSSDVELQQLYTDGDEMALSLQTSEDRCDEVFDEVRAYLKDKGLRFEGQMGPL